MTDQSVANDFWTAPASLAIVSSQFTGDTTHRRLAFLYRSWAVPTARELLLLVAIGVISGVGFEFQLYQGRGRRRLLRRGLGPLRQR